jgi:hypothetical protein
MTSCLRKALQETPWKKCDNCTNTTDLSTLINACSALSSPPSNLRANSYVEGRRPVPLQRSEAHSPAALREIALMPASCLLPLRPSCGGGAQLTTCVAAAAAPLRCDLDDYTLFSSCVPNLECTHEVTHTGCFRRGGTLLHSNTAKVCVIEP